MGNVIPTVVAPLPRRPLSPDSAARDSQHVAMRRWRQLAQTVVIIHVSAAALDAQSVLQGRVVDVRLRTPIPGAEITLDRGGRRALADAEGRFRLDGVSRGLTRLSARALGFAAISATLEVGAADTVDLELTLERISPTLDSVRVEGRPLTNAGKLADFERRRLAGGGTFLTRTDLAAFGELRMSDGLRRLAGITLMRRPWKCGGGFAAAVGRSSGKQPDSYCAERREWYPNACYLAVYVDGRRIWAPGEPDPPNIDDFRAADLEAMEVHRGANVPAELGSTGAICGALLLWTRVGGG